MNTQTVVVSQDLLDRALDDLTDEELVLSLIHI